MANATMRYDRTVTPRAGPHGPTEVTYNLMMEQAVADDELMVLATNHELDGTQLKLFPKTRNAYHPAIPVSRELANGTLRLVCFVGRHEVLCFTEARIMILRIDGSLDRVEFNVQFDLSGEPQQRRLVSCTTLPGGGYRAVIGKSSTMVAVCDVHNGAAVQRGPDFEMLPTGLFRVLGWYAGMPLFITLTAWQRNLYRYDVRANALYCYGSFQPLMGQTIFAFELVGHKVLDFDSCRYAGGVHVYDLSTEQWEREHFKVRDGGNMFTRVKSLRSGEVLALTFNPPRTLLSTFFDQPPRLSEVALRVLHEHMPERTAHALHESSVTSVVDLVVFLLKQHE